MAGLFTVLCVASACAFLLASPLAEARSVIVGGKYGWDPILKDFSTWAASHGPFYVGDTLVFYYDMPTNIDSHDVVLLPSVSDYYSCNMAAKKPAGDKYMGYKPQAYVFHLTKPGTLHFACSVPGHCQRGMRMKLQVQPAQPRGYLKHFRAHMIGGIDNWKPNGADYVAWGKGISPLHVGDQLVFYYSPGSDVYLMKSVSAALACDFNGAQKVGDQNAGGSDQGYVFTVKHRGMWGFASSGNNCKSGGMKMYAFTV